jgi:hypothetical protein
MSRYTHYTLTAIAIVSSIACLTGTFQGPQSRPATADMMVSKLTLVDEQGNTRASLSMGRSGPMLCMFDSDGSERLVMGVVLNDSVLLRFSDSKQAERMCLVDSDAETELRFSRGDTGSPLELSVAPPIAQLILRSPGDKTAAALRTTLDGNGNLFLERPGAGQPE